MQDSALRLEQVSFSYGAHQVLHGIDLDLQPGTITCLLGPSGCGKTTLLQLCAGLLQPGAGRITAAFDRPGAAIGYMQQNGGLLPWRKVWDNVLLGRDLTGEKADRATAFRALQQVGLEDKADFYPDALSGGQQQRVALARQLVMQPDLLLLDEPLGALDLVLRQELATLIKTIVKQHNIAALVVTHSPDEAIFLADQLCLLGGMPATISHRWHVQNDLTPETAFHTVTTMMHQQTLHA